jgi:uncharacterized membrane protein YfhO
MTISLLAIIVAVVLAFIAFKFVKGMIKLAIFAAIALLCVFIAHETGAF